jgi:predicted Ser/Thr protein kinase
MANPQREYGHLDLANELVDAFCLYRLSGQEWQIVWAILRKTWGWVEKDKQGKILYDASGLPLKKKVDRIPLSQFEQMTGIDRRKCHTLLKKLVAKNVIVRSVLQKGDKRVIYEQWEGWPKKVTDTQKGDKISPKKATKPSPKKTPSKENKETLQKKYTQQAEALFSRYPRNIDRANSIKSIINELKSGTPLEDMEAALENYLAIIKREGIQPKFVIGSKEFFAGRWKEYKDGSDPTGIQTRERSSYSYKECPEPECGFTASSVKLDKEGKLIYCPYCTE